MDHQKAVGKEMKSTNKFSRKAHGGLWQKDGLEEMK